MLAVLTMSEQRFHAVSEVLDGASVTEVATRYGVVRQTVHKWLRRYGAAGIAGLVDGSSRPASCPHQMPAVVESRVLALRVAHPGWGPTRIVFQLQREQLEPVPGRSAVYRALKRHGLIDPTKRRRKKTDYRRWERSRSMELWQMDVMGRVYLADGSQVSIVTGIDDHSRFVVCAKVVARAVAGSVCQGLLDALDKHGVPEEILTDNGKVFTVRFGPGKSPVKFDQICHENGIRHLLTAPYSPTTTGKVERLHKTMRREFFEPHDREFVTVNELQAALDAWVVEYNTERPHQGSGGQPPAQRFAMAKHTPQAAPADQNPVTSANHLDPTNVRPAGVGRWVNQKGTISVAGRHYRVGPVYAGQPVEVVTINGLLQIYHQQILVATHALYNRPKTGLRQQLNAPHHRPPSTGMVVKRIADNNGAVSFAGTMYLCGRAWAGHHIDVSIVAGSVQLSADNAVIRVHPIRHDRSKEHGAFAQPNGHHQHRKNRHPATSPTNPN